MAFTYDITTDRGRVRRLVNDVVSANAIFDDAETDAFLAMESASVKRGAALALETIASNEAYVQKVIRLLDLTTDGAKTSDALLKRAALLRSQAAAEDEDAEDGDDFDWAELVIDANQASERIWNQAVRGAV